MITARTKEEAMAFFLRNSSDDLRVVRPDGTEEEVVRCYPEAAAFFADDEPESTDPS